MPSNLSLRYTVVLLMSFGGGRAIACDACAAAAITTGFAAIETAAAQVAASAQALTTSIGTLQTTVGDGNDAIKTSVDDLTSDLTTSIQTMTTDVVKAIQGSTVASGLEFTRQNKVLQQLSNSYREGLKSIIGNALKSYSSIAIYDEVGAGSNFDYQHQLNALQDMYYNSVTVKENAFAAFMPTVTTPASPNGIMSGSSSMVAANYQLIKDSKNELLTSLKYSKILTSTEYQNLMLMAAFGIGTDDSLSTVAKKATFVKLIMDKAPIFRLADSELEAVSPFTPDIFESENCFHDIVPEGAYCTSSYALLNALEMRVQNMSYLSSLNTTREKGVLQELNRSVTIGNIIKSRTLDMNMSQSVGELFRELH